MTETPMMPIYRTWILKLIEEAGGRMDEAPLRSSMQSATPDGHFNEESYQQVLAQLVSDGKLTHYLDAYVLLP